MASSCGYEFQAKHFGFADAEPSDFYSSQWFGSKMVFLCYRIFMFLYCLIWSINTTIHLVPLYPKYYAYLSDWGEWSLVFHFGISLVVAIYGLTAGRSTQHEEAGCCPGSTSCQDNLRWFHRLAWIVSTAVISVNYIITIVYWSFLSNIPVTSAAVNIHQHIMNTVLMSIDLFVSKVPVRYLHFIYVSLYGVIYVVFTAIIYGSNDMPTIYEGLVDWENAPGLSAGVCLGLIFVGSPIIHLVPFGFYHMRALIARKGGCGHGTHEESDRPRLQAGEDNGGFEMTASNGVIMS